MANEKVACCFEVGVAKSKIFGCDPPSVSALITVANRDKKAKCNLAHLPHQKSRSPLSHTNAMALGTHASSVAYRNPRHSHRNLAANLPTKLPSIDKLLFYR